MRELIESLGPEPIAVRERMIGEPAVRSCRLDFTSGVVLFVHDDALVAVLLRIRGDTRHVVAADLDDWIPGTDNDSTLKDLGRALGARPRFRSIASPSFDLDGAIDAARFRSTANWNESGGLELITLIERGRRRCSPVEVEDCPVCADLLVRPTGPDGVFERGGMDLHATVAALRAATTGGLLDERAARVRLDDVLPLHRSRLMSCVESHLTCPMCRRILALSLPASAPASFRFLSAEQEYDRPFEPIPPVETWGDAPRIAQDISRARLVDHEPGTWFLVSIGGRLHLDARYSFGGMIDGSVLIRLDEQELEAYGTRGRDFLTELAEHVHMSAPYEQTSPYRARNLYSDDEDDHRSMVMRAILDHRATEGRA